MRICFVFPSRSRPVRFFKTLDNIRELSTSDNYFVWAKIDSDDESMSRPEILKQIADKYPEVTVKLDLSENKVHSVNRSMEDLPECDIIILQSDDIVWDVKGFDDIIRQDFQKYSPNYDFTIHYPDDHGKAKTEIVSILGINLYRKLGYIYYPEYESVCSDDDFTQMTKRMKCHVFVNTRLYTHKHPMWGLEKWDDQYKHTERPEVYKKDKETFAKRSANNFGII